jgi:hypothetical protein
MLVAISGTSKRKKKRKEKKETTEMMQYTVIGVCVRARVW